MTDDDASSQVSRMGMKCLRSRRVFITHLRPATVVEQVAQYFRVHLSSGKGLSRKRVPLRTGKTPARKQGECTKIQFIGSWLEKSRQEERKNIAISAGAQGTEN